MDALMNKTNGAGVVIIGLGVAILRESMVDPEKAWYVGPVIIALGAAVMALRHAIHKGRHDKAVERLTPPAAALLLVVGLLLPGCATGTTGGQEQDTSQGTVRNTAWGGVFGHYREAGKGNRRTVKTPVTQVLPDGTTAPVLDEDGKPMFIEVIEEGASGPLVLNLGRIDANIEQSPQGAQEGSGTQGKTDTSTPTNEPTTDVDLDPTGP